ncbi:unnamed protein product [Heterobilharzia americana]|nr:unnamed protein product [Heterobilharzia americana]
MNTIICSTLIIFIICARWTTIDAKPFRGKRYASDEKDDNVYILDDNDDQLTGYDEIKRLFEEGSVDNKQPSKTTPPMLTTTTTESERERNDIELEELDDETPCSGGGAIFTYTIHNSDDDESQVDSITVVMKMIFQ